MTYLELIGLTTEPALREKVMAACLVACDSIRQEAAGTTNHAKRLEWVKATLASPEDAAKLVLPMVLAQNKGLTVAQVLGATDVAIQTAVDNSINSVAL